MSRKYNIPALDGLTKNPSGIRWAMKYVGSYVLLNNHFT